MLSWLHVFYKKCQDQIGLKRQFDNFGHKWNPLPPTYTMDITKETTGFTCDK